MPNQNIFQKRVRPVLPRILQEERVFVYVPKASSTSPGIAYFPEAEFTTDSDGKVSLKWPISLQVENNKINNPLETIARAKFNKDEFVNTNEQATITHPLTNVSYSNNNASIKFKRTAQDLYLKPGFMMVDENEFEKIEQDSQDEQDPGNYVKYKLKANNPLEQSTIIKLDNQDFGYNLNNTKEVTIRWPYANNPASGTNRTDGYGLVKIRPNSQDYLDFDEGYLALDINKLKDDISVKPTYGADENSGFEDYNDYVTANGLAKRDEAGNMLLKLTKDAIGLNKVANKSFNEYVYEDFSKDIKNHFDAKLNKSEWDKLFSDWSEPVENTVQKIVTDLRNEDASIYDAIRSNRLFLGFFESKQDLENAYPAGEYTYGSTAYVVNSRSYWRVRTNNVNIVIEGRVPTAADVPDDAEHSTSWYRVGRRDTNQVYQWNGTAFELTTDTLDWVDAIVANEEDIQPYIDSHAQDYFFNGFRLGCRETDGIIKWNGTEWEPDGKINYEWADTYITTLAWNSFVETDPLILKPNGIPSVGSSGKWVNSDHIHPTDQTRLAKSVFDSTTIVIESEFNDNEDTDFMTSLEDGGNKMINIPYVRLAKALHNWNGQNNFTDSQESEDYYWAGTKTEFEAQMEEIKNQTFMIVDDDESYVVDELVTKKDMDDAGITTEFDQRFIITTTEQFTNLEGAPLTAIVNDNRYTIKSLLPNNIKDGQIVITSVKEGANATYDTYKSTNSDEQTLLGLTAEGTIIQTSESKYVNTEGLDNKYLVIAKGNGRNVESLRSIQLVEGGIIVSDGTGAIKSTSFTTPGKLLQTAGTNGELLDAQISVNTLVRSNVDEFNQMGIVVSTGTGEIERQDLGELDGKILVSDGMSGLRVQDINNESLVFINNEGKVTSYPTTANDAGKVLMVQNDGKVAPQNIPMYPTHLPVTSIGANATTGTTLSFGETSVFQEGVLYLW